MIYVYQLIASFFASAGFGILFNAPRRALINCGVTGAVGWIVFYLFREGGTDPVLASYFGAVFLTAVALFNSRIMKMPIIVFITCGIIPLVPGGTAYEAMRHVVMDQYMEAQGFAFEAALVSGAIALGIISTEMADQVLQSIKNKINKKEA
ncbi:threonine/serine exporter family protein [Salinicoccus sp. HZC-1]|uniref:threonine/serine exporter family protein n=1 Tax=Salinicoccus sp. HZC-1 TaxID=3385497 RepID=UPI00398B42B4